MMNNSQPITQKEAIEYLEKAVHAFQRARSIAMETYGDASADALAILEPWLFGNKCPLPHLTRAIDRGYVTPMEFYNFMIILEKITPEVKVIAEIEAAADGADFAFPSATSDLLSRVERP